MSDKGASVGLTSLPERRFEDFGVGDRFLSKSAVIGEDEIVAFAERFDPQPFHRDAAAAAAGPFGGLTASGFHTLGFAFRLFWDTGALVGCSMGSPGLDAVRWLQPVRPGDRLTVTAQVLEARPSLQRMDRGVLRLAFAANNQRDETVMTFEAVVLVRRRPKNK